ncbi:MAG: glutamate synthase [Bilophila wadsworthia]
MLTIKTLQGTHRMSTQDLLLAIEEAVGNGETSFEIEASGQHDIGGPLWNREGKALRFHVTNPGQRVGSMCLDNTEILVDGPAPADVGWLNAGGRIVVRGDAGDTAGHCAAAGVIHIGGRAGARSGSLMKHDPLYAPPELWVLKNVGSFSFEFMGGGKAVVCGYDCEGLPSVLGERPCVGMVGGIVYVRGAFSEDVADELAVSGLESDDIAYLDAGLETFCRRGQAGTVRRPQRLEQWRKIYPHLGGTFPWDRSHADEGVPGQEWIQSGIFSDVYRMISL